MRQYLSAMAWIAVTTAVVAGAQIITTKAAAERRAVTRLNIQLVEHTRHIRVLEAELRTRAGLPELQRWNDAVFQLSAPQGAQILRSAVQLAAYAAPPDTPRPDAAPLLRYAITPADGPGAVPTPARPAAPGTGVVKASFAAAAPAGTAPPAAAGNAARAVAGDAIEVPIPAAPQGAAR